MHGAMRLLLLQKAHSSGHFTMHFTATSPTSHFHTRPAGRRERERQRERDRPAAKATRPARPAVPAAFTSDLRCGTHRGAMT